MGKIKMFWSVEKKAWLTPDPNLVPSLFVCYPAADYEALEAEVEKIKDEGMLHTRKLDQEIEIMKEIIDGGRKAVDQSNGQDSACGEDISYTGQIFKLKAEIAALREDHKAVLNSWYENLNSQLTAAKEREKALVESLTMATEGLLKCADCDAAAERERVLVEAASKVCSEAKHYDYCSSEGWRRLLELKAALVQVKASAPLP